MSALPRLAAALGLALAGAATAVATLAVHSRGWGLPLAVLATLAALVAVPPGAATRLPLAAGWVLPVGAVLLGRPEGDVVLSRSTSGYAVLGLAVAVSVLALATVSGRGGPST